MKEAPGKYDDLATIVRERSEGEAVVVIVLAGKRGSGIAVQVRERSADRLERKIPSLLRHAADVIEKEQGGKASGDATSPAERNN